ncbi:uncharacterized protein [Drosophila virilis]|uniref:Uncharacterized protein, isoform A n=2 Tax=Drosophila virilis TaxID=7244 RepID=B4LN68_DROVI|nr:uncharacterized protein LOC6627258 [Drosophila virilis]EDW60072.1 uncharacterized protein Dvir_GJ21282, isoform A [Drosophila virilis]
MGRRMEITCALIALLMCSILGHCEVSVYPGLRRRPIQPAPMEPQQYEQLMEDHARRRLQQQFEQQLELIKLKLQKHQRQLLELERIRQREQEAQLMAETENNYDNNNLNNQQYDQYDNVEGDAAYGSPLDAVPDVVRPPPPLPMQLPLPSFNSLEANGGYSRNNPGYTRQRIPFAVGPNDERFFDNANDPSGELDSRALEDYEEYAPAPESTDTEVATSKSKLVTASVPAPKPVEPPKLLDTATANFHRIKPQSAAAAAVAGVNLPLSKEMPNEINALIDKLQKQSKSSQMAYAASTGDDQIVLRQHLGMNSEMGVYIVALIAGVSAAVTVGLLALGVTWFHNRTKAAADVDYPAYGITGPNKDVSPSCDRKLAQSAQMYHYQHQKQQIIAMENCQATDGSCGLSDVESDDDNEEGDYTVYECPGLAPTGEMEVKNPLFLDETPATPATGANAAATTTTKSANAAAASASSTAVANNAANNNITQATPQQPATQKKGSVKPNMNLLNAAATAAAKAAAAAAEEKQKRKNKK